MLINSIPVESDTEFTMKPSKENLIAPNALHNTTFYKSIVQYVHDQSHVEHCSNRRYIIYRCNAGKLCGGIGDRQKGIITAFLLALLTKRTFIIDVSYPCKLETILRPSLYDWTTCKDYALSVPAVDSISLHLLRDHTFRTKISKQDFRQWNNTVVFIMLNWLSFPGIRQHDVTKAMNLFTDITNEEAIKVVLESLFKPSHRLDTEINAFNRNQRQGRHLVCAHIRTGRNPSIPLDSKSDKRNPNVSIIFAFLEKYDTHENVIYIATDADEVKNNSYLTFKNVITLKRKIVHVDKLGNMQMDTACEGYFTAILEQYILAGCDTLILTHSNLGFMAAYGRGVVDHLFLYNKKKNVIQKAKTLEDIYNVFGYI
ncbi:uncharacterized protein LOC128230782 [Mya arenaria]|uniref:uncharacterized protein LOC128230782 n=1 Tax=Mya arenaria TaxID=6604 RepID=UPI0022E6A58F|nr:uncharacterized protein LOC128230782 [Mya arenaria]